MKLFAKLMIALLVIAMLLPFTILKNRGGDTLMSFKDFKLPDFSFPDLSLSKSSSGPAIEAPIEDLSGKVVFYKWYDGNGNVQFTSEPPADGVEYSIKGFDPNANVIQAVSLPEPEPEPTEMSPKPEKHSPPDENVNPYTQESIKKLMEDTKNIEKLLNQRFQEQNSAINQ